MRTHTLKTIALSAGLLMASAAFSAYAIDVHVGGISASALGGGGAPAATANTGTGGALGGVTATAKALDSSDGTVADVNVGLPGNNKARVKIGAGGGPLAAVDSNGNPLSGGNATSGVINLGSLFGIGAIGDGGTGGGGAVPGNPGEIVAGLSSADQAKLRANCRTVLRSPASYQRNLVSICRLLKM